MRRWVCIAALLAGFSRDGYVWTVRPRLPVPVARSLESGPGRRGILLTGAWWRSS
jgi:hypothetical protein